MVDGRKAARNQRLAGQPRAGFRAWLYSVAAHGLLLAVGGSITTFAYDPNATPIENAEFLSVLEVPVSLPDSVPDISPITPPKDYEAIQVQPLLLAVESPNRELARAESELAELQRLDAERLSRHRPATALSSVVVEATVPERQSISGTALSTEDSPPEPAATVQAPAPVPEPKPDAVADPTTSQASSVTAQPSLVAAELLEFSVPVAVSSRWRGTIEAKITVGTNGNASSVTLVRGTGLEMWDKQLETALKRARYRPAMRGDTPIDSVLLQSVQIGR